MSRYWKCCLTTQSVISFLPYSWPNDCTFRIITRASIYNSLVSSEHPLSTASYVWSRGKTENVIRSWTRNNKEPKTISCIETALQSNGNRQSLSNKHMTVNVRLRLDQCKFISNTLKLSMFWSVDYYSIDYVRPAGSHMYPSSCSVSLAQRRCNVFCTRYILHKMSQVFLNTRNSRKHLATAFHWEGLEGLDLPATDPVPIWPWFWLISRPFAIWHQAHHKAQQQSHTPYSQMAALLGQASGQTRKRDIVGQILQMIRVVTGLTSLFCFREWYAGFISSGQKASRAKSRRVTFLAQMQKRSS